MPEPEPKCVFDSNKYFGGKFHNYPWCITPLSDMEGTNQSADKHGLKLTAAYVGSIFSYASHMLCDGTNSAALKSQCGGILGNKYVLKLPQKCLEVDENNNVTGQEKDLHKFVDNVSVNGGILTGGAPLRDCDGVIPSALSSAGKINPMGILNAFIGPTKPYCKKVNMPCHLVDTATDGITGPNGDTCTGGTYSETCDGYTGSGDIYLDVKDLRELRSQSVRDWAGQILPTPDYNEPPTVSEEFENLNHDDLLNKIEILFKEDDLSKIYLASITIIFIIIMFRIMKR